MLVLILLKKTNKQTFKKNKNKNKLTEDGGVENWQEESKGWK